MDLTLLEQGINPLNAILMLKRHLFMPTGTLFPTDDESLHYSFCQVRKNFILFLIHVKCLDAVQDETFPCAIENAVELGALDCQICFGDATPHVLSSLRLQTRISWPHFCFSASEFLPPSYSKNKGAQASLISRYSQFSGMPAEDAKRRYIEIITYLQSCGHTSFKVLVLFLLL